ncbi:hypothetical protein VTL71DRAFT_3651 [Oculimacula yallundae]|uniref:Fe2OG dioxygenase domain-containing protein n=1 Tax=Oculimacula yallundae TaxID=86028 RepID=A0ABR4C3M7_9HELO
MASSSSNPLRPPSSPHGISTYSITIDPDSDTDTAVPSPSSPPSPTSSRIPGTTRKGSKSLAALASAPPSFSKTSKQLTCLPATFGFNNRDVLDETYRKAGKLDAENFSTSFHPADFGVLDAIGQCLLPGLGLKADCMKMGLGKGRGAHWGVRAELYKLNVYSGPSGMFQKHVDTPRGAAQFGSLVVCLPCTHKGGQLLISHEDHTSIFDWSTSNSSSEEPNAIKWCAFYSDCEHEVLPVTTGHRVTLTYNLYVSEHVGGILQRYPTTDPSLYPLFEGAKKMLEQPGFMSKGGTLGFYCAHQYAHTREGTDQLMPYALKGIDAVLFAVFNSLGVSVRLRPVLENDIFEREDVDIGEDDYQRHRDYVKGESLESWEARRGHTTVIGANFTSIDSMDEGDGERMSERLEEVWPFGEAHYVQWLNEATGANWDEALTNQSYGNDYSISWIYSHAAIFIDIPSRDDRRPIPPSGFRFPAWHQNEADDENEAKDKN